MSGHTQTIQGKPWAPCAACPRRVENGGDGDEGVCPSRRHEAYCDYAGKAVAGQKAVVDAMASGAGLAAACSEAARWLPWLDRIRGEAPENRPSRLEPPPVPLHRKAVNFAGAVVRHVATGRKRTPDDLYAARLATCHGCENYRESDKACGGMSGCGCYVESKALWLDQKCPVGKWPE